MSLIVLSMSFVTASGPQTNKIYSHLLEKALHKKKRLMEIQIKICSFSLGGSGLNKNKIFVFKYLFFLAIILNMAYLV